jgi:hypothetical protein
MKKLSQVAVYFNSEHGKNIMHDTVAKLIEKFKKTGSVTDKLRNGHPLTSADEGTTNVVLGAFAKNP